MQEFGDSSGPRLPGKEMTRLLFFFFFKYHSDPPSGEGPWHLS